VSGRKRWFLLPPAQSFYTNTHPLVWLREHFNQSEVNVLTSSQVNVDQHWSRAEFRNILSQRGVSDLMGVCDQEVGDMIYMPAFYGHATLNLEENIGLAFEFDRGDC
jgi:hypothetical protein